VKVSTGDTICIDGKATKGSHSPINGLRAIHTVSAYAAKAKACLAQSFVSDKENELIGMREILNAITVKGCVVTIDAMGCRADIAAEIKAKGGDYMLALKGNNKLIHNDIKDFFESELADSRSAFSFSTHTTIDADHGRVETRMYFASSDLSWLPDTDKWVGLKSIWAVKSSRECNGEISTDTRYFISSVAADAKKYSKHIRNHWAVENSLHWILDIGFREDSCKVRNRNAAKNLSTLRKIALASLRKDKSFDGGAGSKRFLAAIDPEYRLRMYQQVFSEVFM
jgi:predicted transposase YbfD/YdcC